MVASFCEGDKAGPSISRLKVPAYRICGFTITNPGDAIVRVPDGGIALLAGIGKKGLRIWVGLLT
ncbi:hypothetical protein GCM10011517_03450 [Actibacterium pelagium]|uniref:Uncharacterized protein n=1 Tax=Actibacterium pelagium TaxID=2029103 RepID=A0A917EG70_9RHOB|nr:hypothetical protein GCM10011517_03450 [Actibacterium pelagium]